MTRQIKPIKGTTFTIVTVVAIVAIGLVVNQSTGQSDKLKLDQRSYDAGYQSPALQLVKEGSSAMAACENMLEASSMFMSKDWVPYDALSFRSGCYADIRDNGYPVLNSSGQPLHLLT